MVLRVEEMRPFLADHPCDDDDEPDIICLDEDPGKEKAKLNHEDISDPSPSGDTWSCKCCTFRNTAGHDQCSEFSMRSEILKSVLFDSHLAPTRI